MSPGFPSKTVSLAATHFTTHCACISSNDRKVCDANIFSFINLNIIAYVTKETKVWYSLPRLGVMDLMEKQLDLSQLVAIRALLDLDESRRSESRCNNIVNGREIATSCQSSEAKALHNVLLKGKLGVKGDLGTVPLDVRDGHGNGLLLAGGVSNEKLRAIVGGGRFGLIRGTQISGKREALVLWLNGSDGAVIDRETWEDG